MCSRQIYNMKISEVGGRDQISFSFKKKKKKFQEFIIKSYTYHYQSHTVVVGGGGRGVATAVFLLTS